LIVSTLAWRALHAPTARFHTRVPDASAKAVGAMVGITAFHYGSYSVGDVRDPNHHRLVETLVVDGVTVNMYEDPKKQTTVIKRLQLICIGCAR
jgi:hypothetical protein